MDSVDQVFSERDVNAVLTGIFDMKANLAQVAGDVRAIRLILEDEDEEEAEEEENGPFA